MQDMTANQPYLLRAFFDWILDNDLTPYMVVSADYPNVTIPTQFINNGQIVLNVSPSACVNFSMDLEHVQFQARFSGKPMLVSFPCAAVSAVYAKENGAGTAFMVPEISDEKASTGPALVTDKNKTTVQENNGNSELPKKPSKGKPGLRVVK